MKYCSKLIEKKNKKYDSLSLNYFRLHNYLNIMNWVDFGNRRLGNYFKIYLDYLRIHILCTDIRNRVYSKLYQVKMEHVV